MSNNIMLIMVRISWYGYKNAIALARVEKGWVVQKDQSLVACINARNWIGVRALSAHGGRRPWPGRTAKRLSLHWDSLPSSCTLAHPNKRYHLYQENRSRENPS